MSAHSCTVRVFLSSTFPDFAGACLHEFVPQDNEEGLHETKSGKRVFFNCGHEGKHALVDWFKSDLEARSRQVWKDCERIGP